MERTLKDDDVRPASGMAGQFYSRFNSFGATVAKEEAIELWWNDPTKLRNKVKNSRAENDIGLPMDQLSSLILYGLDNMWMAMTGVSNANSTGKVKIPVSIGAE
jgi:hypothetical protein